MLYEAEADQTVTQGWDMNEGLTQVNEEEEDWEAGQASFLSSNLGQILAWTILGDSLYLIDVWCLMAADVQSATIPTNALVSGTVDLLRHWSCWSMFTVNTRAAPCLYSYPASIEFDQHYK
jgi:hypothetical protein